MLDYSKDCFRGICEGIKINKTCCYIQAVVVMLTIRQDFSAVTKAFIMVNDRWPAVNLSAGLHETAFRIAYGDNILTFDRLLAMDKSFCAHHQKIQRPLIKIYKTLHDISGNSWKELFLKRDYFFLSLNLWYPQSILFSKAEIL